MDEQDRGIQKAAAPQVGSPRTHRFRAAAENESERGTLDQFTFIEFRASHSLVRGVS